MKNPLSTIGGIGGASSHVSALEAWLWVFIDKVLGIVSGCMSFKPGSRALLESPWATWYDIPLMEQQTNEQINGFLFHLDQLNSISTARELELTSPLSLSDGLSSK